MRRPRIESRDNWDETSSAAPPCLVTLAIRSGIGQERSRGGRPGRWRTAGARRIGQLARQQTTWAAQQVCVPPMLGCRRRTLE